jgi:hypothetical protein
MSSVSGVEQAFADLAKAPNVLQSLIRPVLVRALQDPALMRHLGGGALPQHLNVLGQVLLGIPTEGIGAPLPNVKTFLQFAIGEDVDDAEAAYDFVRTLDAPLRGRVEGGLTRALQSVSSRAGQGTISLLALARLLALAFANLPFVAHVLDGGPIEPFLPRTRDKGASERRTKPQPSVKETPKEDVVAPRLASFLGAFVEVVSVVQESDSPPRSGHVFLTIGRVVGISPTHVQLETLRGQGASAIGGHMVVLGMAHVVIMRMLTTDNASA